MRRLLLAIAFATVPSHAQELPRTQETITVERILVDARVTKGNGEPILGLKAEDFRVLVDGKPAKVESVLWIPETTVQRELAGFDVDPDAPRQREENVTMNVPEPEGRLLIFFFQTDFAREEVRTRGQMKILRYADEMIDGLEAEDRVAVFSYDSHLKFRLDFTDDKDDVKEAMRQSLDIDEPLPPRTVPSPALKSRLDPKAMRDAGSPEEALLLLGNALRPIPGPKSLILFGWGLGRLSGGQVKMGPMYLAARQALEGARVSVFSIDITQADWHSLGVGLAQAAADTGGFYADTFHFPKLAIDKLQKTLSGHYELEVIKPQTNIVGVHTIEVTVKKRGAVVMARGTYVDKP